MRRCGWRCHQLNWLRQSIACRCAYQKDLERRPDRSLSGQHPSSGGRGGFAKCLVAACARLGYSPRLVFLRLIIILTGLPMIMTWPSICWPSCPKIPAVTVDPKSVETNMVFMQVPAGSANPLRQHLAASDILLGGGQTVVRLVTHLDVRSDAEDRLICALDDFLPLICISVKMRK